MYIFSVVVCANPPNGEHTKPVPPGTTREYDTSYVYSCMKGYETNDTLVSTCMANGRWSLASPPVCTSMYIFYCCK